MSVPTLTLAHFLLARIAEDETAAAVESDLRDDDPYWTSGDAENWERHMTPARVLAECAAKRRIVGRLAAIERAAGTIGATTSYAEGYDHGILDAARFLALPYADHPDYREEWRP